MQFKGFKGSESLNAAFNDSDPLNSDPLNFPLNFRSVAYSP